MEILLAMCTGLFMGGMVFWWGWECGNDSGVREGRHQEQEERLHRLSAQWREGEAI